MRLFLPLRPAFSLVLVKGGLVSTEPGSTARSHAGHCGTVPGHPYLLSVFAHLPLSRVPLPFLLMSWPFLSPSDCPSVPCPELIHKPRPDRLYWILDTVAGLTLFVPSLTLLSHISNCSVKADNAPLHWFCPHNLPAPPRPPCVSPFPGCFPDPLAWLLSFPCEFLWQFV